MEEGIKPANHTASNFPDEEKLVVETHVAPIERPTEKALGNGSQRVLIVTPTPPKVRESREWKPSLQYIKPLNAGENLPIINATSRLYNFSFDEG